MRVAVISDIHANRHALEAVLGAVDAEAPDEIWCLGDTVGYGPEPNRCCALVAERATLCLAGNHDLAVTGALSVEEFNGDAAAAVRWTRQTIDAPSLEFLRGLSPQACRHGVALFHASPLDPIWDYVLSEQTARLSFQASSAPVVLVGHSHLALVFAYDGERLSGGLAVPDEPLALAKARFLLNPGSVGQPRGKDPRAAWMMLDLDAATASFRRTAYAIGATQEAMRARGLPEALAARLTLGV
jgi:diadenosine tetraphosphatase ApaH/serine/threonine PP2A family protein phosphatase